MSRGERPGASGPDGADAGEWIGDWLEGDEAAAAAPRGDGGVPEHVEQLPRVPEPRTIYLAALARAGRAVVSTTRLTTSLPDLALRADLTLDRAALDAYAHLLGERALDTAPPPSCTSACSGSSSR
ncbi:hypothetical protein [Litorihabitans aurantiacus]|uniref:Uncharacterized protein n=1 Tax=Litorihabitans aurantiacus TaxID=1930061 RepID=A0AA37UGT8_9MICO|nr:hypothetical protein [Litorihabitans aurantiacus]GMA30174.1 hypothetical protein GCM10025875_01660 [Litorihabitans aurantiacus]